VPEDWKALSAERIPGEDSEDEPGPQDAQAAKGKKADTKPVNPYEDWSLVRTKDKLAGWVLTRNLTLSIPDEVAQYAEGKRIAAYFEMGTVQDEEKGEKHYWLWAVALTQSAWDYDALRIFTWNRRKHRYETAWRERDLEGYFPIEVKPPEAGQVSRQFSAVVRDDDGKYWIRSYQFDGIRARLTGKAPYTPPGQEGTTKAAPLPVEQMEANAPQPGWFGKQWAAVKKAVGL
jgi:hypothetical protein